MRSESRYYLGKQGKSCWAQVCALMQRLKWVFYLVMAFPCLAAFLLCGQGRLWLSVQYLQWQSCQSPKSALCTVVRADVPQAQLAEGRHQCSVDAGG